MEFGPSNPLDTPLVEGNNGSAHKEGVCWNRCVAPSTVHFSSTAP